MSSDIVSDEEIIILSLKPSLWYILLASLGTLLGVAFIAVLLAYLSRWQQTIINWTERDALLFGLSIATIRLGWQALDWWNRSYILTDRRLIAAQGVFRRSVFQTPLRNIQHLAVIQSIRERVLGLGSIAVATAGSDTYDASWVAIRKPYDVHKVIVQTIDRYGRSHLT